MRRRTLLAMLAAPLAAAPLAAARLVAAGPARAERLDAVRAAAGRADAPLPTSGRAGAPLATSGRAAAPIPNSGSAGAEPLPDRVARLARGIAITNWFRYPPSQEPAALARYLGEPAIAQLRRAGFTAVRLPVQPEFVGGHKERLKLLASAVARLQRHGLAVLIAAQPSGWRLETSPADRAALLAFWQDLAPLLRELDPHLSFPELLNEPVFPGMAQDWQALQHTVLAAVRDWLPQHTVVLTGNDWSSVGGLLALRPEPDPNVVYSFHFYEPAELTSLAAYRPGLDRAALARLPFPAADRTACFRVAEATDDATAALIRFYCGLRWNVDRVAGRIAAAAAWGRRNRVPVLLGEFGATAELPAATRLAWLATVRAECEALGIGWMLWGYDDVMGLALPRPPPAQPRLDAGVLHALGLPPV